MTLDGNADRYDQHFFEDLRDGARRSAQVIAPLVADWVNPQSVVDVGCGDGTWLSVFRSLGVQDVLGVDGNYVRPDDLQIPAEYFLAADLKQPLTVNRTFDLVISLEVAEHLPPISADLFVNSLVKLGPVILFSAAIPCQGGQHHVNEQWPSYWVQKFKTLGYSALDCLRSLLWDNSKVELWYAQNCLLFIDPNYLSQYPRLPVKKEAEHQLPLNIVHPRLYLQRVSNLPYLTKEIEFLAVKFPASNHIMSGSDLNLEITLNWQNTIKQILVNLEISDRSNRVFLQTTTQISHPQNDQESQILNLNIDALDLFEDEYFLNIGCYSPDWSTVYDLHWRQYTLQVDKNPSQQGIIKPKIYWQVTPSN